MYQHGPMKGLMILWVVASAHGKMSAEESDLSSGFVRNIRLLLF